MSHFYISGVRLESMGKKGALMRIRAYLQSGRGTRIFTPNSLILYKASNDSRLPSLLNCADMLLPDGIGISLACRIHGKGKTDRVSGIDTAEWVMRYAAATGLSVYLLGGKRGVAALAAKRLESRYPSLCIAGVHHGYFDKSKGSKENRAVLREIRKTGADIVFVCMGFPMQEAWIQSNRNALPHVRLFMGLGGSLDVWSGKVRRAPRLFRAVGIEWLWRVMCEPRRAKELLALPRFLLSCKVESEQRSP